MRYKENKTENLGIRNLKKTGTTAKSRKVPFFNKKDYRIFAAVNGITD